MKFIFLSEKRKNHDICEIYSVINCYLVWFVIVIVFVGYPFFEENSGFAGIIYWGVLFFLIVFLDPLEYYRHVISMNGLAIVLIYGPGVMAGFLIYINNKRIKKRVLEELIVNDMQNDK